MQIKSSKVDRHMFDDKQKPTIQSRFYNEAGFMPQDKKGTYARIKLESGKKTRKPAPHKLRHTFMLPNTKESELFIIESSFSEVKFDR